MTVNDTLVTSRPKPNRRRTAVTLSLNSEMLRQLDAVAADESVTRSRFLEFIVLSWIRQQMAEESA